MLIGKETQMEQDLSRKLALCLLLLRISVGLVMMVWAFDKILNPSHGAAVFESFYGLEGVGESVVRGIGFAQAIIVLAFLLGVARKWTYGAVLLMHGITTLVSWSAYLQPLENILFFAAWPMLAALVTLFLLRNHDRMASLGPAARES
jgi:putative oxidoreductase